MTALGSLLADAHCTCRVIFFTLLVGGGGGQLCDKP